MIKKVDALFNALIYFHELIADSLINRNQISYQSFNLPLQTRL